MKVQGLLVFLHILGQCARNTDATTLAYTYSPPPNVTLSPDDRLQLVWSHVLTPSEIRWCYWQQKPKVGSTWTKVIGYDVTNKQTLNISAHSWLYKFMDSQSPCKSGLWSLADARDVIGFYQMNVVANNGTQYKSPVVEVGLIRNDSCSTTPPIIKQEECSYTGWIAGCAVLFVFLVVVVFVIILYFTNILPDGFLKKIGIEPYKNASQRTEIKDEEKEAAGLEEQKQLMCDNKNSSLHQEDKQTDDESYLSIEGLADVTLQPGDDLELTAKLSCKASVRWFRYRTLLKESPDVEFYEDEDENGNQRVELRVKKSGYIPGVYTCKATKGQVVSESTAIVTIQGDGKAPFFSQPIVNSLKAEIGQKLELHVILTANPLCYPTWHINGKPIFQSDTMKISNVRQDADTAFSTLTIDPCRIVDSGEITVQAKNKLGKTICSGSIILVIGQLE